MSHKKSIFSYGGKIFLKNHSLYLSYLQSAQIHVGYLIPLNKTTSFVSHYKYDNQAHKSTAILGFKQKY